MARMLEAGPVEQRLGDRVGDDGCGLARTRVFDGKPDRLDDGGRIGRVWLAGQSAGPEDLKHGSAEPNTPAASDGCMIFCRDARPASLALRHDVGWGDHVERALSGLAGLPGFPRNHRADPCGVAHRQRKGKLLRRGHGLLAPDDCGLTLEIAEIAFGDQGKLLVEEAVLDLVARGQVGIARFLLTNDEHHFSAVRKVDRRWSLAGLEVFERRAVSRRNLHQADVLHRRVRDALDAFQRLGDAIALRQPWL